jgi:hypothetical protein
MNFTRGANIWLDCGITTDYIKFALLPWEWITGGYFSLVFASLMMAFTYIKYHKVIYPILIGFMFLPISYFLFPETFISTAIILGVGLGGGGIVYKMLTRRTKDFG